MSYVVAHASTGDDCLSNDEVLNFEWLWHGAWLLLIASLFALVYLNFSIRVNTAKLNALLIENSRLQTSKDMILLDKERLQMYHLTKKKAKEVLGYRLAKKTQVVNITV